MIRNEEERQAYIDFMKTEIKEKDKIIEELENQLLIKTGKVE